MNIASAEKCGAIFCANVTILEAKRIKRVGRRSISSGVAYEDVGKEGVKSRILEDFRAETACVDRC